MIRRVTMRLSNKTLEVLKNFSNINQNILIEEGNVVRTISTMKNILGSATIDESFPNEFGIYDLNEFLGVMSLASDAELEFETDKYLTINGGSTKIRYFFSDPSIIVAPPKTFNAPDTDVTFEVSQETLAKVLKAAAVMQLPDIVCTNGSIASTDLKNSTSNSFTETLADDWGTDFKFHFKADNLKMIPGTYKVSVSSQALVSHWVNTLQQVDYWIALEQTSGE